MLLFATIVAAGGVATTTVAPDRELIESLFPPPPAGWRLDAVQISYDHGARPTMSVSPAATGFLSRGVRVTARRRYVSDVHVVVVAIATNDIEGIVRIDAINVASTFSANLRMSLDEAGMTAVEHDGRLGIVVDESVDRLQVFPVGAAGTVTIRCERAHCGDLFDRLPRLIEWDRIDAVVNSMNVDADGPASGRTVSAKQ